MKIKKSKIKKIIKESFFKNMRQQLAGQFDINFLKNKQRDPLATSKDIALFMSGNTSEGIIILYEKIIPIIEVTRLNCREFQNVIGFISYNTTNKPCIPETVEVKFIAVDDIYRGKGYGPLLYGIMFQYAKDNGLGVTSDHTQSSSDDDKAFWKQLTYTREYSKKQTQQGNNEFDYDNATTDPDDDCDIGTGIDGIATNYSWIINNDMFKNEMNKLLASHENHINNLMSTTNDKILKLTIKKVVEINLEKKAYEIFQRVF